MEKVTVSISPFPPFFQMNLEIPMETLFKGFSTYDTDKLKSAELMSWALSSILEDQFSEGDAKGAWSIRYKDYLLYYYGSDTFPPDISIKDTITFSAWIARPLLKYCRMHATEAIGKALLPRLFSHKEYLFRRYNDKIGGFGLPSQIKLLGKYDIAVDLRHTVWAMLTLIDYDDNDPRLQSMLRKTGAYLSQQLSMISPNAERALTYSALHSLITHKTAATFLCLNEAQLAAYQKQIESVLCEKFNPLYRSWDLEVEEISRIRIINSLLILQSIHLGSIRDRDLLQIVNNSIDGLLDSLIRIDRDRMALPLVEKTTPDIGASIQLLKILKQSDNLFKRDSQIVKMLLNYILDPLNRMIYNKFAYPWHLSALLELV